jgi:hypothetical protein
VAVFAGEICTISAPVTSSTTLRVTDDDAAPTITETSWLMRSVTDCVATSALSASEESVWMTSTSWPSTPPASLISSTARLTPAISGGPRYAREPVWGRRVPIFRGSAVAAASSVSVPPASSVPPLEQAVRTSATAPVRAAARTACVERIML